MTDYEKMMWGKVAAYNRGEIPASKDLLLFMRAEHQRMTPDKRAVREIIKKDWNQEVDG